MNDNLSRVVSIETKFQDFMDRYERDQKFDKEWKSSAMSAIEKTTSAVKELSTIRTAGIWILITAVGALFVAVITKLVDWIGRHF